CQDSVRPRGAGGAGDRRLLRDAAGSHRGPGEVNEAAGKSMNKKVPGSIHRAVILQLAGLALGGVVLWYLARQFPVVEYITRAQRKIGELEIWGGVLYPLLYGVCNV